MVDGQRELQLSPLGIWSGHFVTAPWDEARAAAASIEAMGFGALWYPETPHGREAVSQAALLLTATERVRVCSGIASIWARDAVAAAQAARLLNQMFGNRFVLGLGVSHAPVVTLRGRSYDKPLSAMRAYLDGIDECDARDGANPSPRLIAALAPRMLDLARTRAAGVLTYFVPPEHTVAARRSLGDGQTLAVEQAVVLETDARVARETARLHTRRYLALPNYRNNLLRLGFEEADLSDGGSDELVDRIVAWGDPDAIAERLRAHVDAGADHVAIQPLTESLDECLSVLRELQPAAAAARSRSGTNGMSRRRRPTAS